MRKTTTKLQLKKQTIRILQSDELKAVAGGAPTALCTQQATGCLQSPDDGAPGTLRKPDDRGAPKRDWA